MVDWPGTGLGTCGVAGSWTLQADQAIGGSLYLSSGTLDVGGFSLTVAGGVYQAGGDFNAHSGAVTVGGDVVVSPYGVFSVGGGAVDVAGGLTVGGTARLQMTDAAGVLEVSGDVTVGGASTQSHLTAGTLKVGGDFVQLGDGISSDNYADNFMRFQLLAVTRWYWTGTAAQAVSFEKPSDSYSHFQNLVIANTSVEGSVLQPGAYVLGDLDHQSGELTGSDQVAMYGSGRLAGDWPGDLRVAGSWTLQADQAIGGSLYLSSGTLDVGGVFAHRCRRGVSGGWRFQCPQRRGDRRRGWSWCLLTGCFL